VATTEQVDGLPGRAAAGAGNAGASDYHLKQGYDIACGDERTRVQVFAMRSMASGAAFHRAYLFMLDRHRSDVSLEPPGEYSTS
jgi:hypothetical protein